MHIMNDIDKVKQLLDSDNIVVAQVAPAVRFSLGEEFGAQPGTEMTGQIITALKKLGFEYVFDTSFGADIVAIEEAYELNQRLKKKGPFPLFTSCCIGWKLYALKYFPDKLRKLSTCMAPQITLGALSKTYFAKQKGVDPAKVKGVSIMPCIAKKIEAKLHADIGIHEVNFVLTTCETARLMKDKKINPMKLKKSNFDKFLGNASRGGKKFGASGGVAEAIINVLYRLNHDTKTIVCIEDDTEIGNYTFKVGRNMVNVIRVYGLSNFLNVIKMIEQDNKKTYHLVEIMTCPYGCCGGPGQPLPVSMDKNRERALALRKYANAQPVQDAYSNPDVIRVYKNFLTHIGSAKAKTLMHIGCELCKVEFEKEFKKEK